MRASAAEIFDTAELQGEVAPAPPFRDRADAGRKLAVELRSYASEQPVVVALARGGVPVGGQVARALHAPLEACVVRKLGLPWDPEVTIGAIAQGGFVHLDYAAIDHHRISPAELSAMMEAQRHQVEALARVLDTRWCPSRCTGRTVLLVDDGLATGATMLAAILALRSEQPKRIVLAVPVAARGAMSLLEPKVERVVALVAPESFHAVSDWYEDFTQVRDQDVIECLADARERTARATNAGR